MKKLYGLTTAMITPFDSEGNVDLAKHREMVQFQIKNGTHCLYPCGTTGEMYLLSEEERKSIAEETIKAADGKAVVYIHVGAMSEAETIRLAQHAEKSGADGIGIVTPSYFKFNDKDLESYFIKIAHSVSDNFPVYLYNIPQCSGNDLKPQSIINIRKASPNVVGIKYSFADFVRTMEYVNIDPDFSVVIGADILFVPGLAMGCSGTVSGCASVYPEAFVAIYEAYKRNDIEEARRLQNLGYELANILKNGSNMSYFKTALAYRGYEVGKMRAPLKDLSETEKDKLIDQLKNWERKFFKK